MFIACVSQGALRKTEAQSSLLESRHFEVSDDVTFTCCGDADKIRFNTVSCNINVMMLISRENHIWVTGKNMLASHVWLLMIIKCSFGLTLPFSPTGSLSHICLPPLTPFPPPPFITSWSFYFTPPTISGRYSLSKADNDSIVSRCLHYLISVCDYTCALCATQNLKNTRFLFTVLLLFFEHDSTCNGVEAAREHQAVLRYK